MVANLLLKLDTEKPKSPVGDGNRVIESLKHVVHLCTSPDSLSSIQVGGKQDAVW
jgi:hypothetical protein